MKNIGSMRVEISRNFEKMRISQKISRIFKFFEFFKKERQDNWGMKRHSTSPPCGNLVDGLPHDCHNTGARGNLVPNRPSLFIPLTCLKMFLLMKTIMTWNCDTWKVFFTYWSLILAEYEHHVIMSLQFPSDSKFLWAGHFWDFLWKKSIFKRNLFDFWNFQIFEIFKSCYFFK